MNPPADASTGGSGPSVSSIRATQSRVLGHRFAEGAEPPGRQGAGRGRDAGTAFKPAPSAATSRGPAVPTATRAKRRSRSPTSASADWRDSAASERRCSSSTASHRASSSTGSIDGCASASRSARAPSGVRVRSISAKRLRSRVPSEDSKSSSVAIADWSRPMREPNSRPAGGPMCSRPPGRIWWAYARAADAAARAGAASAANPGLWLGAFCHHSPFRRDSVARKAGAGASSGSRISRGRKSASASSTLAAGTVPAWKRPVERSRKASPQSGSPGIRAARYEGASGTRDSASSTVPGVTTRVMSRRTRPLAARGSSTWSQTATLRPAETSFEMWCSTLWCGTPHIGASMSESLLRRVRAMPSSGAASFASSKNIS